MEVLDDFKLSVEKERCNVETGVFVMEGEIWGQVIQAKCFYDWESIASEKIIIKIPIFHFRGVYKYKADYIQLPQT